MAGSKRRGKFRKRRFRKRGKWRQQKVSIGTIQRISRDIAKREDKKNLVKYVHSTIVKDAGHTWTDKRALPPLTHWYNVTGDAQDNQIPYKIISNIGGNVRAVRMQNQSTAQREKVSIKIHGVESFLCVYNASTRPCRAEFRLIFIPNMNQFTNDITDYLRPRITMFHDTGGGSLLYTGYNKKAISAQTATGIPFKFQTLSKKVLYLPAAGIVGTQTPQGGNPIALNLVPPQVFRRFKLSKYFKKPRTAYCNDQDDELSNGNYFLVWWNDLPGIGGGNTMRVLATSNVQYSMKSPMLPDLAQG